MSAVGAYKLVLLANDIGNLHVMGGGRQILQLLASEDVEADQVNLSVTVLARLRSRHLHDLARAALEDDVTVLPQRRALHRKGGRGARIGALECVLMLQISPKYQSWKTLQACALHLVDRDSLVLYSRRGKKAGGFQGNKTLTCASSAMMMRLQDLQMEMTEIGREGERGLATRKPKEGWREKKEKWVEGIEEKGRL